MRARIRLIGFVTFAALMLSGCGRKAAQAPVANSQKPITTSSRATVKSSPKQLPLPDWTPKNPSPEFLRANKVLKPLPNDLANPARNDPVAAAQFARYNRMLPANYELFGSLSEKQIARFLATRKIRLPVKSLSNDQRQRLDNWLETWRKVMKGTHTDDWLVLLYKRGAKEDLSNVDVGFDMQGGHYVDIMFWVRQPDGTMGPLGNTIATVVLPGGAAVAEPLKTQGSPRGSSQ